MTSSSSTGPASSRSLLPEMTALRARVGVAALQMLLTGLGVLMALASRRVDRFRRQVTRDLLLEIRGDDSARQQYRLRAATRRLTLPRRPVQPAECTLSFPTARVGLPGGRAVFRPSGAGSRARTRRALRPSDHP